MESIPNNKFFHFHSDTMDFLRKKYNFAKPGEMDEAIDLLQEWVKKQIHFLKKDFARPYLERIIILNKGSVERAKCRLDKICTLRTLLPNFFDKCDAKKDLQSAINGYNYQLFLKDLTVDHYRVFISKLAAEGKYSAKMYFTMYLHAILLMEYAKIHDYCDGYVFISDIRGVNIVEYASELNLNELTQMITIIMEGHGARLKQIHILSESKAIDLLMKIIKQLVSNKVASRIRVHKTVDELYQYVPRKILPADMGGDEKPMNKLHDEFTEELSKPENVKYFMEMRNARTDESLVQQLHSTNSIWVYRVLSEH